MIYDLELAPIVVRQLKEWARSGQPKILLKVSHLLEEIKLHPTTGTGKPERLKGRLSNTWSRRLTKKDRIVYRIDGDKIIVYVLSVMGHYDDK